MSRRGRATGGAGTRVLPLLFAVAACADADEPTIRFTGQPGQLTPVTLVSWVPLIKTSLGPPARDLLLTPDSGAEFSYIPRLQGAPERGFGSVRRQLKLFGLTFPDRPVVTKADPLSPPLHCGAAPQQGVIGGELLSFFRLGLDYRGKQAALFAASPSSAQWPTEPGSTVTVPLTRVGGGSYTADGDGITLHLPRSLLVVSGVILEDQRLNALVDTGSSYVMVAPKRLKGPNGGPRGGLCCPSVDLFDRRSEVTLVRARSLTVGAATVNQLPVAVWKDGDPTFEMISKVAGRRVDMIIGGSFLRYFKVLIDYPANRLVLNRHNSQDHVSAGEFVGPGFSFCPVKQGGAHQVVEVFKGSDAELNGVKPQWYWTLLDGEFIGNLSAEALWAKIRSRPTGALVTLGLWDMANNRTFEERKVRLKDLLPSTSPGS